MVIGLFTYGALYYLRCAAMNGWVNWKDAERSYDGPYIFVASRH
jgi:hypothetical protein